MSNYLSLLWQRLSARDSKADAEVARIAVLQQAAAKRRAEYADEIERAAQTADSSATAALAASRKRMAEAESAHTAALQAWDNKQSRQKSR